MDNVLSVLAMFVEESVALLKSGIDFAKVEIPQILKEIIYLEIGVKTVWLLVGVLLVYLCNKIHLKYKSIDKFSEERVVCFIIGVCSFVGGVVLIITSLLSIVKAGLAPRVYLIEYFIQLSKTLNQTGGG